MAPTTKTMAQLIEENERLQAELHALRRPGTESAGPRDILREERYRAILNGIDEGYYEVDLGEASPSATRPCAGCWVIH